MSVRQYIGARYVPLFYNNSDGTAEWRSGVSYEPLTIVTYNGNSYTSRRLVPANVGNPSANPTYWASTGIYNQQIDIYRQEVQDVSTRLEVLEDRAENPFHPISMNKVIFVGDSYSLRGDPTFPVRVANRLGLANTDYVLACEGSTGFAHANSSGNTFETLLLGTVGQVTAADVSHIIVCGGANDSLETDAAILAAMQSFRTAALTAYPNAKVFVGFIGATTDATKIREYARACYQYQYVACNLNDFVYLDGVESIMHNRSLFEADGVHPTGVGVSFLGSGIADAIITGHCNVAYANFSVATLGSENRAVAEIVNNEWSRIWTHNTITLNFSPAITLGTTRVEIGDLGNGFITGSYYEDASTEVACSVIKSDNTTEFVTMPLCIYNGKLWLEPNRHVTAVQISNVVRIIIDRFNLIVHTIDA